MADITRKSIDYYTFIGGEEFASFIEQPDKRGPSKEHRKKTNFGWKPGMPFQTEFTNISNEDLNFLEHSGRFRWEALRNGTKLGGEFWEISPVTGSMQVDKYPDSPTDMMRQVSRTNVGENWAYSYGFYDSGAGFGELTNHDQSYVYITRDVSNWMGTITRDVASIGSAPFHNFILPGSHDAGTYNLEALKRIAYTDYFKLLLRTLFGKSAGSAINNYAFELATNFAVTQKDDVKTQLDLGARYFDFRPGSAPTELLLSGLYHQHAVIPGVSYDAFLFDTINWLQTHPREIAVVCVGFAGFLDMVGKPSYQTLDATLKSINGRNIVKVGDHRDFARSYNELIASNTRLLVVYAPETGAPVAAKKYDSYSAKVYETTKSANIIGALNGMSKAGQNGYDYTVLQLQGTASSVGIAGTLFNASKSGSPLMSTKPAFDSVTYPWVLANARQKLGNAQLTVLLNDFVDSALTLHAMKAMAPDRY
ncbi:MAG TPA: hypothetical protein VGG48_02980 [Rhizomicrobium sp.]